MVLSPGSPRFLSGPRPGSSRGKYLRRKLSRSRASLSQHSEARSSPRTSTTRRCTKYASGAMGTPWGLVIHKRDPTHRFLIFVSKVFEKTWQPLMIKHSWCLLSINHTSTINHFDFFTSLFPPRGALLARKMDDTVLHTRTTQQRHTNMCPSPSCSKRQDPGMTCGAPRFGEHSEEVERGLAAHLCPDTQFSYLIDYSNRWRESLINKYKNLLSKWENFRSADHVNYTNNTWSPSAAASWVTAGRSRLATR